jgi:hypothetical protein
MTDQSKRWIPSFEGMTDLFVVTPANAGVHASNQDWIPASGDSASRMGRKRLGVSGLWWKAHELTMSDSLYQLTPYSSPATLRVSRTVRLCLDW